MFAYNPRKKSPEQLEKSMVGEDRWDILRTILKELSLADGECPKQHWVLVGPRGIGKSHFLTLLYHKVKASPELDNLWISILFPEELRMAKDLSCFLERSVREILLEFEKERNPLYDELRLKIEEIRKVPLSERSDYLFSIITWIHQATRKFILLVVENLQQLLGKKFSYIDQKKLRAYLQTSDAVLLMGSATTVFDALHDHSKPFYNFFHIKRLEDLNFEDMKILIADILSSAGQESRAGQPLSTGRHSSAGEHGLTRKVFDQEQEARLRALYSFTGGNPRMAVFLADILKTDVPGEILTLMDQILDELTPYFEGMFGDVPAYLLEIINTLSASYEPAQSPKEIAETLELPQPTVRNYLKQLKKDGYVRVAFPKGKSHYYCLSEYLYRIWYQMRDSGHREETRWLIELLLMLYSPASIIEQKKGLGECAAGNGGTSFYSSLIDKAADFISRNPDYCKVIELCVESISKSTQEATEEWEKQGIDRAIKLLMSKQYDKAIEQCEEVLRINPTTESAYRIWGTCLRKQDRYDEAIEMFKKALEINPNLDQAYWAWGACLREQEQYGEAIDKFKKAVEFNPSSCAAHGAWGDCLRDTGRYDEAEEKYRKATELNPKYEDAYLAWNACLRKQGRHGEAIEMLRKALEDNPNSEQVYGALGECLRKQDRYGEAIGMFKKALEINPNYEAAYAAWGNCLRAQGQYDKAIELFKKVLEINPDSENAYLAWAYTLIEMEHYDKAIAIIEEHLLSSNDYSVIYLHGTCLLELDRYEEALKQFESLVNVPSYRPLVYLLYGQALEKMGNQEGALLSFIKHIMFSSQDSFIDLEFKDSYEEHILPILETLTSKSENYIKQFYFPGEDQKLSRDQLSILLILMDKYDVISEHIRAIIADGIGESDKEGKQNKEGKKDKEGKLNIEGHQDFGTLIFTIKLSIWLKLCEGAIYETQRLVTFYLEYIKSLSTVKEKEKEKESEVSSLLLSLFILQINEKVKAENVQKVLERFEAEDRGKVPFNDIFRRIWICLADPDSVDAQRNLTDKAIAEVIRMLKSKDTKPLPQVTFNLLSMRNEDLPH